MGKRRKNWQKRGNKDQRGGGGSQNNNRNNNNRNNNQKGGSGGGSSGRKNYTPIFQGNIKFEAYYAYQGIHNSYFETQKDDNGNENSTCKLVKCINNEQKEIERKKWLNCMRDILPASFRFGLDIDESLRNKLLKELNDMVGNEMEIWVSKSPEDTLKDSRHLINPDDDNNDNDTKKENDNENNNKEENEKEGETKEVVPSTTSNDNKEEGEKTETNNNDENNNNEFDDDDDNDKRDKNNLIKKKVKPIKKIPFIPYGYQMSLDRRTIRRNPKLSEFHKWLTSCTEAGYITRQETVSQIPPIVLNVKNYHSVLDMCAAPGSKTSQLLELIMSKNTDDDDENPDNTDDNNNKLIEPKGYVVANDSDVKRAYMLTKQVRRINSPNIFLTSCDAQFFPLLKSKQLPNGLQFDRILCDVPCSGDGTTRKNPGIWKNWSSLGSIGLHRLQLGIALTGIKLLKVGGYMCYSTCSMNPIENEAVITEIIRQTEGSIVLVDPRDTINSFQNNEFKVRPGLSSWKVLCEEKSKKSLKNFLKKNNTKMQKRRKEYEEQNEKEAKETGTSTTEGQEKSEPKEGGGTEMNIEEKEEEEKTTEDEKKQDEEMADDGDNNNDVENVRKLAGFIDPRKDYSELSSPKSWDEETLKKRALEYFIEYKKPDDVPDDRKDRICKSLFPPTDDELSTNTNLKNNLHLSKCIRCLPHDMDTGGFFIALLKKVKPLSNKVHENAIKIARCNRSDVIDDDGHTKKKSSTKNSSSSKTKENNNEEEEEPVSKKPKIVDDQENAEDVDETKTNPDESATDTASMGGGVSTTDVDMKDSAIEEDNKGEEAEEEENPNKVGNTHNKIVKGKPNQLRGRNNNNNNNNKKNGAGDNNNTGNDNFIPVDRKLFDPIIEYYGLSDEFPVDQYFVRNDKGIGEAKCLYFVGKPIKNLIDSGIQNRITIINSGLKGFERNTQKEAGTRYRIAQEAIQYIVPYMSKRVVVASFDDYNKCLDHGLIRLELFTEKFRKTVQDFTIGSFAVILEGYENDIYKKMFLVMWRCQNHGINCLVSKTLMNGMKSKLNAIKEEQDEKK